MINKIQLLTFKAIDGVKVFGIRGIVIVVN